MGINITHIEGQNGFVSKRGLRRVAQDLEEFFAINNMVAIIKVK